MRTAILLSACALLLFAACDGALGGNIHDRPVEFETTQVDPSAGRARTRRERPVKPETPVDDTATSGSEDPAPVDVGEPVAADPAPSGGGRSGGRSGGRGRGGKHGGVVTVVDAGAAVAGTAGRITGSVDFEGTPPTRIVLDKIAETEGCAAHQGDPLTEEVVVNDGKLQNVFVYLKSIPNGVTVPDPPDDPMVLEQRGCMFLPHVAGVQAGRKVIATNEDGAPHNVRVSATRNEGPNATIGVDGDPLEMIFEREEVAMKVACDIHPWMTAWVCVVEHPWFAVSAADGSFTIEGVPPGTYKIEGWHERYGKAKGDADVVVGPGGHVQVVFTYAP